MESFDRTKIWRASLAPIPDDPDADSRERLRRAFIGMRANSAVVAAEIGRTMPQLTVHDVTHLDALWEMADFVVGDNIDLTPTEALVLGGAFLLHDLGMGISAFPGGMVAIRATPEWRNLLAWCIRSRFERPPGEDEMENPPDFILAEATQLILRLKHAEKAERLATYGWTGRSGEQLHLLPDDELRVRLGRLMGQLAHSHWWDVDLLPERFGTRPTSLPGTPVEWTIDQLKLACLMRLSDAAHLDSRRAPTLLYALRSPMGTSDLHWGFQERLERPHADGDRLVYTSLRPFERAFADHWWLAFDSLRQVDEEFRKVDALLYDLNRPRFAIRGVAGVETPERFRRYVRTEQWLPVDAELRVGDVPNLVGELGGEALYGDDEEVGIRELVQNSVDAIHARQRLDPDWAGGHVLVRLRQEEDSWYLDVIDDGIGMSQEVLTGILLDFGRSLWRADTLREEYPGLSESNFESVGRFGIGFYAVFMLGSEVSVTTNRFDSGASETSVLEFPDGVSRRAILRPADPAERILHGGTRVSVRLYEDPWIGGILDSWSNPSYSLAELCLHQCPAAGADLDVKEGDGPTIRVIEADDWRVISPDELFDRLHMGPGVRGDDDTKDAQRAQFCRYLRDIGRDGKTIARLGLRVDEDTEAAAEISAACLTIGGLRAEEQYYFTGMAEARPLRAARDRADILASDEELVAWSSIQEDILLADDTLTPSRALSAAETLRSLWYESPRLPIAVSSDGLLSLEQVASWAEKKSMVKICMLLQSRIMYTLDCLPRVVNQTTAELSDLEDSTLLTEFVRFSRLHRHDYRGYRDISYRPSKYDRPEGWEWRALWYDLSGTSAGEVIEAIANSWSTTTDSLMASVKLEFDGLDPRYEPFNIVADASSPVLSRGLAIKRAGADAS